MSKTFEVADRWLFRRRRRPREQRRTVNALGTRALTAFVAAPVLRFIEPAELVSGRQRISPHQPALSTSDGLQPFSPAIVVGDDLTKNLAAHWARQFGLQSCTDGRPVLRGPHRAIERRIHPFQHSHSIPVQGDGPWLAGRSSGGACSVRSARAARPSQYAKREEDGAGNQNRPRR